MQLCSRTAKRCDSVIHERIRSQPSENPVTISNFLIAIAGMKTIVGFLPSLTFAVIRPAASQVTRDEFVNYCLDQNFFSGLLGQMATRSSMRRTTSLNMGDIELSLGTRCWPVPCALTAGHRRRARRYPDIWQLTELAGLCSYIIESPEGGTGSLSSVV